MINKVLIAKIVAVHGIKGNLKVRPFTEKSDDIFSYKQICDANGNEYKLKLIGHYKDNIIVNINNINDRNDAEKLIGTDLYVARAEFTEAKDNEFYYSDLLGVEVLDMARNKIGTVKAVHNFGAGDILEINFIDDIKDNHILFNKENFPEVDIANKFIVLMQEL
jgi:16S rRNA processing protein RimM